MLRFVCFDAKLAQIGSFLCALSKGFGCLRLLKLAGCVLCVLLSFRLKIVGKYRRAVLFANATLDVQVVV